MHLAHYLGLLHRSEGELASALRQVAAAHRDEPDVAHICEALAEQCTADAARIAPFADRYGEDAPDEPERLHGELFRGTRGGALGLLRDLHDLYLMTCECDISWTVVGQAAQGARDRDLLGLVQEAHQRTTVQQAWIKTRMKQAAPQVLVVAS